MSKSPAAAGAPFHPAWQEEEELSQNVGERVDRIPCAPALPTVVRRGAVPAAADTLPHAV